MSFLSFFGALSPVHITWVTVVCGAKKVGIDSDGNRYFRAKARLGYNRERRWVIYKGEPEASGIPPEWHAWLHHQVGEPPENEGLSWRRPWQKPPLRNMTGTQQAYRPPGHLLSRGERESATGDYRAWIPPESAEKR